VKRYYTPVRSERLPSAGSFKLRSALREVSGSGLNDNQPAPRRPIHYTKGVQAHWRDAAVGAQGELRLEGLPFEPGEPVEVLVISKSAGARTAVDRSLQDSVLEYRDPTEPVAGEDWDALQ